MAAQGGGDVHMRVTVMDAVQPPQKWYRVAEAMAPVIGEIEQHYAHDHAQPSRVGEMRQSPRTSFDDRRTGKQQERGEPADGETESGDRQIAPAAPPIAGTAAVRQKPFGDPQR